VFESLNVAIAIGVIFLIFSMVNKYLVSLVKRLLKVKAIVIAGEMEAFIGKNTTKFIIPFMENDARHLNFLEKIKKGKVGFRKLNEKQLGTLVDDMSNHLLNISNYLLKEDGQKIVEKLGLRNSKDEIETKIKEITDHLKTLKTRIGHSHDQTMQKISEVYENNIRKSTFYCGIALAIFINADFFSIYNSLSNKSMVRDSIVASANTINDKYLNSLNDEKLKNIQTSEDLRNVLKEAGDQESNLTNSLSEAGLILGWRNNEFRNENVSTKELGLQIFMKVVGIFISALLISFGAPFWHEFLSSFTGIKQKLKSGKIPDNGNA
jgi:hypothetical protein